MIDRDFVEQKVKLIKNDLQELKELKPAHWEIFLEKKHQRYLCEQRHILKSLGK